METLNIIILSLILSGIIVGFISSWLAGLQGFVISVLTMSTLIYPIVLWYEHNQAETARQKYGHYVYMGGDLTAEFVFAGLIIVWSMISLGGLIALVLSRFLSLRNSK